MAQSNGVVKAAVAIAGGIAALAPVVDKIIDMVPNEKNLDGVGDKNYITIPTLCEKGFPIRLNQATELLTNNGLKVIASEISLQEASAKYKDCLEYQVVGSKPRAKQRVLTGTTVIVRYVTKEVIEESKRIFEESEKQKAELNAARAERRAIKRAETKQAIMDVAGKTKSGIEAAIHRRDKTI